MQPNQEQVYWKDSSARQSNQQHLVYGACRFETQSPYPMILQCRTTSGLSNQDYLLDWVNHIQDQDEYD